ncbi:hypothetical protein VKT23_008152 [Stygiomarasmius scandens]|uniref:Uncharacterized protein n=1 Tax=Marasmiellus scandens TaxID=2682957 RepID=A0ABR1JLP7_9AGAR
MSNHIPEPIHPVPQQHASPSGTIHVNWFQPINQASPPLEFAQTVAGGGSGGSGGGSDDGSSHSGSDRWRNDERNGRGVGRGRNSGRGDDLPKGGRKDGGGPPDDGPPGGGPGMEEEGSEQSQTPKNTLGKCRRAIPFGEIQPEELPHYETEFFEYKPETPQGQVNLKEQVFQMLATLIEW